MTYLNQLMRARRLTKAELSRKSGIPDTTLRGHQESGSSCERA